METQTVQDAKKVHWTQTPEGRLRMAKIMKQTRKKFKGGWPSRSAAVKRAAKHDLNEVETAVKIVRRKSYGRMLYSLAQDVRQEIHAYVRNGGELDTLHTRMLTLTDQLLKPVEEEEEK